MKSIAVDFVFLCVFVIACGTPAPDKKITPLPANSVHLELTDLFTQLCTPGNNSLGCDQATRVLIADVKNVSLKQSGAVTQVNFMLGYWNKVLIPSPFGNPSTGWEVKYRATCYEINGTTATPGTQCGPNVAPGKINEISNWTLDALGGPANIARAVVGSPAEFGFGIGRRINEKLFVSDVSATTNSFNEYFGAGINTETMNKVSMLGAFTLNQNQTPQLLYLIPAPDDQDTVVRTMNNVGEESKLYWADRSDSVYTFVASENQIRGTRVRKSVTNPQTTTVGIVETPDAVKSLVLSASGTTLSGLGAGPVYELSFLSTNNLKETEAPLIPFGALWAHTPNVNSLVVCFNEPLDDAKLNVDQFSANNQLKLLGVTNSVVPQCARFYTSPMSRNLRYQITVKNVTSRSGAVVKENIVSATPDDTAQGISLVNTPTFSDMNPLGFLPLANGTYFAAKGPIFGVLDATVFQHMETGTWAPPLPSLASVARADPSANGVWVNYSETATSSRFALYETNGTVTQFNGAGNLGDIIPLGDGSILTFDNKRYKKGMVTPEVYMNLGVFSGAVFPAKQQLYEDMGKFKLIQLPATAPIKTFIAPPNPTAQSRFRASACETQNVTYWCGSEGLFRLGETNTELVSPAGHICRNVSADNMNACWSYLIPATGIAPTMMPISNRIKGATVTPFTIVSPVDGKTLLTGPEFMGDAVFLNARTLRTDVATWNSLTGAIP
jgi:hypothetical protein